MTNLENELTFIIKILSAFITEIKTSTSKKNKTNFKNNKLIEFENLINIKTTLFN